MFLDRTLIAERIAVGNDTAAECVSLDGPVKGKH